MSPKDVAEFIRMHGSVVESPCKDCESSKVECKMHESKKNCANCTEKRKTCSKNVEKRAYKKRKTAEQQAADYAADSRVERLELIAKKVEFLESQTDSLADWLYKKLDHISEKNPAVTGMVEMVKDDFEERMKKIETGLRTVAKRAKGE